MSDPLEVFAAALADRIVARVSSELVEALSERTRLVWIKDAPVAYRPLLAAIGAGEIRAYRVGAKTFVDRSELEAWVLREGHRVQPKRAEQPEEQDDDEVAQLIAFNNQRRHAG